MTATLLAFPTPVHQQDRIADCTLHQQLQEMPAFPDPAGGCCDEAIELLNETLKSLLSAGALVSIHAEHLMRKQIELEQIKTKLKMVLTMVSSNGG